MRVGRTYEYTRNAKEHNIWTFGILAVLAVVASIFTVYKSYSSISKYRDYKASFKSLILERSGDSVLHPENNGNVIHVTIPQTELIFERNIYDPYLNVEVPGAVSLDREVEYCQWAEHVHERRTKSSNDNDNEHVVRTYTYTKTWRTHLINSLFFDQPAAHYNPQRNPVRSGHVDTVGLSSTHGYSINAQFMNKLRDSSVPVAFRPERLKNFVQSPASVNDKFFYTGSDGWFLSKYEPGVAETAMKMAFQYLEGTLLDFQLGDLFNVCDAGDIRVRLHGKVINDGISIIAEQRSDGNLVPFKSLSGRDIMLVRSGHIDSKTMIDDFIGDKFKSCIWYSLGFIVSAGLSYLFVHLTKQEMKKNRNEEDEKTKNL